MSFMKKYKENMKKAGFSTGLKPPQYYLDTGNYVLNRLMSDNFLGGSAQGRLVCFAGHASSGKSLVAGSHVASVVKEGGFALVIDSEGALDDDYMRACGVDVDDEDHYGYVGVSTVSECSKVIKDFITMYKDSGEDKKVLIVVDSLDNLLTDNERDSYDKKGEIGGDQGQRAKQIKTMLKPFTHTITSLPITIICTKQVYKEQDQIKAYAEPWVFTSSLEYAFSQIIMFEKLQFKDKSSGEHKGFTLKAKVYKSRVSKEKQVAKVEVPYEGGMDRYSGLLDVAEQFGVVTKAGAWYTFGEEKFQRKKAEADLDFMKKILDALVDNNTVIDKDGNEVVREVNVELGDFVAESETSNKAESAKSKRLRRLKDAQDGDES
jgi:recombination protein RecA